MNFNNVTASDIEALRAIAGPDRVLTGAEISEDYGHDELGGIHRMPEVLVRIMSTEETSAVMRLASAQHIPVTVRGSGTGLVGGSVAIEGGILLETAGMKRILELDPANLTVTVQPGVLLMDLQEYVQANGFFYPPDPGEKTATIGGNISTNAGGMRAVKYGVTRDYVRGLTAVLPDGAVLRLGGKVVKNSSGYALKDLIVGSEGTLAVVTEAVLKLLPLPAVSVSLLVPFGCMDQALDAVPEIIRSNTAPTAVEYMSRETILFSESYLGKRFPNNDHPCYLLLTCDGTREQVDRNSGALAELCLSLGAEDVFLVDTDERKDSVWSARGAFLEAIKNSTTEMDECDVVVPRDRVADFIRLTQQISGDLGIRIPSFGHAGDGNLHVYVCRDQLDDETWRRVRQDAFQRMYSAAAEMGGLVSGEHGIGYAKKGYLAAQFGEETIALMRRVKAAFDPDNILNPGKVCE